MGSWAPTKLKIANAPASTAVENLIVTFNSDEQKEICEGSSVPERRKGNLSDLY